MVIRMYSFKGRVRYSETDRNGKLNLESLIDYFQDCSTFQSEDLGVGVEYLKERHLVWVLASWQVVILDYPKLCDEIEIGTIPYDIRGFLGYRNFFMKDKEGRFLAKAASIWTLLDTETMRPGKTTQEMLDGYRLEERLPMEYAPRKIDLSGQGKRLEEIMIRSHNIDSNNHVNNGQYVQIAMEYLPEGFDIKELRVEYKKQAVLHDMVTVITYDKEDGIVVALCDPEEKPYAIVEFTGGRNA